MSRPAVFLTHSPSVLANYYGPRALAALEAVATVRCARETWGGIREGTKREAPPSPAIVSNAT